MMNALRLSGGVPRRLFAERTGLPLAVIEDELKTAREQDLVEVTPDVIRPTERGRHFLNDLLTLFLRD